jgi:transposase
LSSYIGLIPNNHSSGEKECIGRITFRGVAALKTISDFHQFNLADWGINF